MRTDHFALRVKDRQKTAQFYIDFWGYYQTDTFDIDFDDGKLVQSIVLAHPNGVNPEIFITDGEPGSIVDNWVNEKNGIGGLHHIALRVEKGFLDHIVNEWKKQGIEFTSEAPITCPDGSLRQIFTKPSPDDGVITELLEREDKGFCRDNVKALILSTEKLSNPKSDYFDDGNLAPQTFKEKYYRGGSV